MLHTEYVRSLQSNYAKILLEKKPEENRYQYCIMNRGSIKGLLPCSLRYINGSAYLYYDITSKQSIMQIFGRRCIDREWLKDFMWSVDRMRQELGRFLLDDQNIIWFPEQVYQDLERNNFSFLYFPYYEGEGSFIKLLDFWIENIDYEDELLVECVYKMYEQYEQNGDTYLQKGIFDDLKILDREDCVAKGVLHEVEAKLQSLDEEYLIEKNKNYVNKDRSEECWQEEIGEKDSKRGIRYFFEERRRKNKEQREQYRQDMEMQMTGYAVAEEVSYAQEEYGRTIYIEETQSNEERVHRLMSLEGCMLAQIDKPTFVLGKKKDEVDLVLDSASVSRMHARIIKEQKDAYIEDLNSTNGTFRNGFRLLPYEKKKLEEGDELKFGKVILIYR